jgi:hypothetical protein
MRRRAGTGRPRPRRTRSRRRPRAVGHGERRVPRRGEHRRPESRATGWRIRARKHVALRRRAGPAGEAPGGRVSLGGRHRPSGGPSHENTGGSSTFTALERTAIAAARTAPDAARAARVGRPKHARGRTRRRRPGPPRWARGARPEPRRRSDPVPPNPSAAVGAPSGRRGRRGREARVPAVWGRGRQPPSRTTGTGPTRIRPRAGAPAPHRRADGLEGTPHDRPSFRVPPAWCRSPPGLRPRPLRRTSPMATWPQGRRWARKGSRRLPAAPAWLARRAGGGAADRPHGPLPDLRAAVGWNRRRTGSPRPALAEAGTHRDGWRAERLRRGLSERHAQGARPWRPAGPGSPPGPSGAQSGRSPTTPGAGGR